MKLTAPFTTPPAIEIPPYLSRNARKQDHEKIFPCLDGESWLDVAERNGIKEPLRIFVLPVAEPAFEAVICGARPHRLDAMQNAVGGLITCVSISDDADGSGLDLWLCDDLPDDVLPNMHVNQIVPRPGTFNRNQFFGDGFITRRDRNLNTTSLTDDDVARLRGLCTIERIQFVEVTQGEITPCLTHRAHV